VGIEPWLVLLVNGTRTKRFIVAVQPDGTIEGRMDLKMNEFEELYWQAPRIGSVRTRR
jgi:hypothetical protein